MRKIVVPTDFSGNAWNAIIYAINLANLHQSELYLVNVYEPISTTGMLVSVSDFMKKDSEDGLSATLKEIQNYLKSGTIVHKKALLGKTVESICSFSQSIEADLIVMGTQGASGLKAIFLGSNASGVMRKTSIPFLAVPNTASYEPLKNIAFALDSEVITTSNVIEPLLKLVRKSKSKIDIIHVEKENELVVIDAGVDIYLEGVPHTFFAVESNDIKSSINYFVEKKESNLLCMIKRNRGFLGNLFHNSITKKEVFDSKVPILVLSD